MLRNLAIALLVPALAAAANAPRPAEGDVSALRLEGRDGRTELTVQIAGGDVRWTDFPLQGPPRVVVDIQGARSGLSGGRYDGIDRGGVKGVRTSQHAPDVVRVVIDLERDYRYAVTRSADGLKITLESGSQAFQPWNSGTSQYARAAERPAAPNPNTSQVSTGTSRQAPTQVQQRSRARPITVTFENTDMRDVLATFAELTGRSIVPGSEVGGIRVEYVTFTNQPWDLALRSLLQAYGLAAQEDPQSGIIRVDQITKLAERETLEPLVTRTFRINYVPVEEMQSTLEALKSDRGSVSINKSTNTLIATDVPSVVEDFERLVGQLDVRTPQVAIQAKIVFINRTDAEDLGIVYDIKDSRGNSLNKVVSVPDPTDPTTTTNDNVVSLGGSSIAALGNANTRVQDPALQVLTSLVLGRYTLINFIEALQRAELSDVQAAPVVTTTSNHEAQIWVGERTPIRVVDLGSTNVGTTSANAAPRATAQLVETGIRLIVTPQVTNDRRVLLQLHAERSSAAPAAGEIGVQFLQQQGDTRVMVKDGETAVIGGLTVTEVTQSRTGIPFLMDIPFLGSLFRTSHSQEVKRDLLIMVTPHIVEETP
ncbi:AMIN domain-containing protein [Longimicrobium sp.]|uniref:AMIN domain-containing protein n=1 Tax=Longimicrobium sp. TaxID=2029185 RepID=UPI002BF4CE2C|nr:AMIN domain-containing protein [Longimicrobium sp.]HSU13201.1 AMIN domain-containing protein [Longimicrobium sp.]